MVNNDIVIDVYFSVVIIVTSGDLGMRRFNSARISFPIGNNRTDLAGNTRQIGIISLFYSRSVAFMLNVASQCCTIQR